MPALRADLGLVAMTALAVSMMLGAGIFFGPTLTAREFPDARVILALWGIGAVVAIMGAWVFGRLAAQVPLSGGPYAYLRETYGPLSAFLYSWTSLVIIAPTSMAVMASLLASNAAQLAPMAPALVTALAIAAIGAFAAINLVGVGMGGRVQSALSILKVLLVAGLLAVLLFATGPGPGPGPGPSSAGTGRWSLAFVGILFAYGGWEYAVLASEEVRDASRNVPRGLLLGTAIVCVLYVLTVSGFLLALGGGGVASATALGPEAVRRVLPQGAAIVAGAIVISAAGTINAVMLLGPRATFALARDGQLPALLARVSSRGVPYAAILLQAILAVVYLLTGAFETVAAYTVLGTGAFIVVSAIALLMLRKARGVRSRWAALETLAVAVVAGTYAWFILFLVIEAPETAAVGLGIILAGAIPYAVLSRGERVGARS